jgi:hypothetical protein
MIDTWKNILRHDIAEAARPFSGKPATPEVKAELDAAVRGAWTRFVQMAFREVHEVLKEETLAYLRTHGMETGPLGTPESEPATSNDELMGKALSFTGRSPEGKPS